MDYDGHAAFHKESASHSPAAHFFAQHTVEFTAWRLVAAVAFMALVAAATAAASVALAHVADLAETNTAGAKKCLRIACGALAVAHAVVLVFDSVIPWYLSVVSLAAQAAYSRVVAQYPWVESGSPTLVAACVVGLIDSGLWYWYLLFPLDDDHRQPLWAALSFLLVAVWGVPIMLTSTLSISDDSLPGAPSGEAPQGLGAPRRRIALFNWAARAVGARDNRSSKLL
uniref:Uncharacterized protein n=2 Tax=Neobodo designis TaxID=312471 RepID=A0A7S1MG11_NEODS|mmetsp:Transcript_39990/g.123567  ORF Transcript_39990/g.123567 Transcript_39990/m.123567 type:complete len:227 (+) Transcript_39990:65-745(+)